MNRFGITLLVLIAIALMSGCDNSGRPRHPQNKPWPRRFPRFNGTSSASIANGIMSPCRLMEAIWLCASTATPPVTIFTLQLTEDPPGSSVPPRAKTAGGPSPPLPTGRIWRHVLAVILATATYTPPLTEAQLGLTALRPEQGAGVTLHPLQMEPVSPPVRADTEPNLRNTSIRRRTEEPHGLNEPQVASAAGWLSRHPQTEATSRPVPSRTTFIPRPTAAQHGPRGQRLDSAHGNSVRYECLPTGIASQPASASEAPA